MTTINPALVQSGAPFAIYEDPEDRIPHSPSATSESNEIIIEEGPAMIDDTLPNVESLPSLDDEPAPYRRSFTSRKSISHTRCDSSMTHYSLVSAIPSEVSIASRPVQPSNPAIDMDHAPRKERPRFRNPESVRAMQMSSPPLLPVVEAPRDRTKGPYKLTTPSRSGKSETPGSRRSGSRRGSVKEYASPMHTMTPQQAPLVLLHVTILPMQAPYSHDLMERIMPAWLVENYRLLEEKLQDIILLRRGLLIPHPRDEYDLLEERILESLELKTPRLLKCGHFVPPEDGGNREDIEEDEDETSIPEDGTGRGSRMSGNTMTEDLDVDNCSTCSDCHRELKRPGRGVGLGARKWDIKVYAANGLMRVGAWTACWNDMERCDVEISPWVPAEVRRMLEVRAQEEQEAEKRKQLYANELQQQMESEAKARKAEEEETAARKGQEQEEIGKKLEAITAQLDENAQRQIADRQEIRNLVEEEMASIRVSITQELEAKMLVKLNPVIERLGALDEVTKAPKAAASNPTTVPKTEHTFPKFSKPRSAHGQIPLQTLLYHYLRAQLLDRKNLVILCLSALIVLLTFRNTSTTTSQPPSSVVVIDVPTLDASATARSPLTTTVVSYSKLVVTETLRATATSKATVSVDAMRPSDAVVRGIKASDSLSSTEDTKVEANIKVDSLQDTPTVPLAPTSDMCVVANPFQAVFEQCRSTKH